ncbi:hypothetical protein [Sediminispirochaeta smaragdinae]|uniref:Lipoprotein n=1 Tax=Sediminispirochaeta smaragdinae (strain DSM 11293 / JCM 15392 / SEBR 4228) TaxID=573413 RepID=E1R8G1_SEDSS|nr:hypothetical protein [Sediminispirochaeta smaragdinae]ADK79305.1 hypothetical protein Spirs_0148 [Sediminispirochaeta smaragdinae DSM 11293]
MSPQNRFSKILFFSLVLTGILLLGCGSTPKTIKEQPPPSTSSAETGLAEHAATKEREGERTISSSQQGEQEATREQEASTDRSEESAAPPKAMSKEQLMLSVIQAAGQRFTPVRRNNGTPLLAIQDIDQNGEDDAFVLTVEQNGQSIFQSDLGNVKRLYQSQAKSVNYYLSVYFQIRGKLISMYRIPFGGRMVLDGFRAFHLRENALYPYAVEAAFQNHDGLAIEWVIFSSYNQFSLFSMHRSVSIGSFVEDIDEDGLLDIVEWHKGIEEGTGYETFLTWYRWNGTNFGEAGATNIVRNLNAFLSLVEEAILTGTPQKLTPYLSRPVELQKSNDLLKRIFTPLDENSLESGLDYCDEIVSIIYPPILENPFSLDSSSGKSVPLDLRLICKNSESLLCRMEIAISKNPFVAPQYRIIVR